jgi:hypothetical protein
MQEAFTVIALIEKKQRIEDDINRERRGLALDQEMIDVIEEWLTLRHRWKALAHLMPKASLQERAMNGGIAKRLRNVHSQAKRLGLHSVLMSKRALPLIE